MWGQESAPKYDPTLRKSSRITHHTVPTKMTLTKTKVPYPSTVKQ